MATLKVDLSTVEETVISLPADLEVVRDAIDTAGGYFKKCNQENQLIIGALDAGRKVQELSNTCVSSTVKFAQDFFVGIEQIKHIVDKTLSELEDFAVDLSTAEFSKETVALDTPGLN